MAGLRHVILFAAAFCAAFWSVRSERRARIVEGVPARIEEAPWLVQMLYLNPPDARRVNPINTCAGSIVSDRLVLTAAHCFGEGSPYRADPSRFMRVLVGATDKLGLSAGRPYAIESVATHPRFNDTNQKYDLAVVRLRERIQFNSTARAIPIAKQRVAPHTSVMGGGWGVVMNNPPQTTEAFHRTLKTATMTTLPDQFCRRYIARTDLHADAVGGMVCMQPGTGMPCFGDSGSGLWVPARGGQPAQLFGVLQGGVTCELRQGVPFYIDLLNSDLRPFLLEHGVPL